MHTVCQVLRRGTEWVLMRSHLQSCVNQPLSLSQLLFNARSIFIKTPDSRSSLCFLPHVDVNDICPSVTGSRTLVPENVSFYHTDSPSNMVSVAFSGLDTDLAVNEHATIVDSEVETDVAKHKGSPRKALDEVSIEKSPDISSFIDDIGPPPPVSFNFAAYINISESLQQLVKLGVDLSQIEEKGKAKFLHGLDFERDMKKHIQFLHDVGVPAEELGIFLTKNPDIFHEDLDNLKIRINYLEVKKFSEEQIACIVTRCPLYLSLEVKAVDRRLGFLQHTFGLTGSEVRQVVTKYPKLVLCRHRSLLEGIFAVKEIMGFSKPEMKQLLLTKPKLYTISIKYLTKRFNIVHNKMGIPHERIVRFPRILMTRDFIVEQRHKYLVKCGRAQYDPTQPNYISLEDLVTLSEGEFCRKCAKSSVLDFNEFLKTL